MVDASTESTPGSGRCRMRISATIVLGAWIVTQIVMVLTPQIGPVAWWAHIGGLVAGALLVIVFKRSDVRLFDKGLPAGARIGR